MQDFRPSGEPSQLVLSLASLVAAVVVLYLNHKFVIELASMIRDLILALAR